MFRLKPLALLGLQGEGGPSAAEKEVGGRRETVVALLGQTGAAVPDHGEGALRDGQRRRVHCIQRWRFPADRARELRWDGFPGQVHVFEPEADGGIRPVEFAF